MTQQQTLTTKNRKQSSRRQVNHAESVRILMIDDHPSQIDGYSCILKSISGGRQVEILPCYSFSNAYTLIMDDDVFYDIIFLDMSMPAFPDRNIISGDDMALLIRKRWPKTKIAIITAYAETFTLYNAIKKITPEGVLVKSDFQAMELREAYRAIMSGEIYYSDTVREGLRELLSRETYLDAINRQIIILLAQGVKTKHLPDYLHISLSAIEKRKAQLRDYFCMNKGSDDEVVREARKLGFI